MPRPKSTRRGESEPTISPADAASRLNVNVATIRRWCDRGLLRFRRTPTRQRRIVEASVEVLLVAQGPPASGGDAPGAPGVSGPAAFPPPPAPGSLGESAWDDSATPKAAG